ncbi:hypothetical protein OAJ18_00410 [Pelagibacteraceae bacterium]|nr:hypothetical protein [Pelagibacteraceae bacterium]
MSDLIYSSRNVKKTEKNEKNGQFSEHGVFVKEDDQDWGSSGMNDIQKKDVE